MRKRASIVFLALVFLGVSGILSCETLNIAVTGNLFRPADSNFRDLYGSSAFFPEIRVEKSFHLGLSLWGSYSGFSKDAKSAVLGLAIESKQSLYGFGLSYKIPLKETLKLRLEAGLFADHHKEEGMGVKASGTAIGLRAGCGLVHKLAGPLSLLGELSYMKASDTVEGEDFDLGGLRFGFGFGLSL